MGIMNKIEKEAYVFLKDHAFPRIKVSIEENIESLCDSQREVLMNNMQDYMVELRGKDSSEIDKKIKDEFQKIMERVVFLGALFIVHNALKDD